MIALRIVHIVFGVFWVGGVLLMNFLVGPALTAAGPAGMRVMQELNRRRYFDVMMGAALLSILAGLDMVRRDSANFDPGWFRTRFGMGISTGMVAAVIAFLIGILLVKPAMRRMAACGAAMADATDEEQSMIAARFDAARGKLIASGGIGSLFLIIAVIMMAIARYL